MPVNPTYPGVYVEELPSTAHTVSGVSTSNTAFADFFAQGPIDRAVQITSFRDLERIYGGLHPLSEASYGLLQYFNNGGQNAWIVRVVDDGAAVASCSIDVVTPTLGQSTEEAARAAQEALAAANAAVAAAAKITAANAGLQANIAANQTQAAADAADAASQAAAKAAALVSDAAVKKQTSDAAAAASKAAAAAGAAAKQTQDALAAVDGAADAQDLNAKIQDAATAAGAAADAAKAAADAADAASTAAGAAATAAKTAANNASTAAATASTNAAAAVTSAADDAAKTKATAAADKAAKAAQAAAATATQVQADGDAAVADAGKAKDAAKQAADAAKTAADAAKAAANPASSQADAGQTAPAEMDAKALTADLKVVASQTSLAASATRRAAQAAESASLELELAIERAGATGGAVGTEAKVAALDSAEAAQNAAIAAQRAADAAAAARDVDPGNAAAARAAMEGAFKAAGEAAAAAGIAADKAVDANIAAQEVADAAEGVRVVVSAANPGMWGNTLRVSVMESLNGSFDLFAQQVKKIAGKLRVIGSETYRRLTLDENSPRYAVAVVNDASSMIQLDYLGPRIAGAYPESTPTSLADGPGNGIPLTGGANGGVAGAAALMDQVRATLDYIAPSIFNLLCLPGVANYGDNEARSAIAQGIAYCAEKRALFLVDIPARITKTADVMTWTESIRNADTFSGAVYYPRLVMPDPLQEYRARNVAASGTLAGIYARTDTARGVWKAPAGIEAAIQGAELAVQLTDQDSGTLNPLGINALRSFPVYGSVVWGARTLSGADQIDSQWKYVNVRRLADYIEESLFQGLKWVVFEPNVESTWSQIRVEVNSFLAGLFAGGAFQGATPDQAFFVHCDSTTTNQTAVDRGIVNIIVGFAPAKPAEFVILQIEQIAGQTS
jgi:hypothetical protein